MKQLPAGSSSKVLNHKLIKSMHRCSYNGRKNFAAILTTPVTYALRVSFAVNRKNSLRNSYVLKMFFLIYVHLFVQKLCGIVYKFIDANSENGVVG